MVVLLQSLVVGDREVHFDVLDVILLMVVCDAELVGTCIDEERINKKVNVL